MEKKTILKILIAVVSFYLVLKIETFHLVIFQDNYNKCESSNLPIDPDSDSDEDTNLDLYSDSNQDAIKL